MFFNNLNKNFRRWRAVRRTVAELSMLGDRELADLGIARHDIRAVARGEIVRP